MQSRMDQRVFTLLAISWYLGLSTACPESCSCQPEGRGQSVWCSGKNFTSIIRQLPHNTARLKINGAALETLSSADLEDAPKSIQHLTITNTNLHTLEDSTFSDAFTSLQELDLNHNRLRFISKRTFTGLSSLRLLNLSFNDLDILGACLEPLVSLQQLDVSFNFINELQPTTLHAQSSLIYLRLDGNEILSLGSEAFQALSFLTELRLQNCSISYVSESFLSAFPRMSLLDLSYNRLTAFPSSRGLKTLPKLKHLYLHDNSLLQLQPNQFDGMQLYTLSLARNHIGILSSQDFRGMTVKDLDISQNKLTEVSHVALQPLAYHLLSLNLAYNPIHDLSPQIFGVLGTLEILNISACSLSSIPTEVFSYLYNLRTLDISENLLQNISQDMIAVFSRLVRVSVQDNPWHCDCHITPFRNWLKLRQSMHKLFCPHGNHQRDCTELRCFSPEGLKGKFLYNLSSPKELNCGTTVVSAGLPVPVQISIVVVCLLVAFGMLFLTMYLWRRGRTKKELKQLFKKRRKPDSHEEDEEEGEKIEPFMDCDNESLKESHRSFIFKEFFDKMVTDPKLLDPPTPSQVDPEEVEVEGMPKQKDSMYSSNPSLYETSHRSCSVVVVGIESTV